MRHILFSITPIHCRFVERIVVRYFIIILIIIYILSIILIITNCKRRFFLSIPNIILNIDGYEMFDYNIFQNIRSRLAR